MEVTVKMFNKGTGLVLPAFLYIHMSKYTSADIGETWFSQTSIITELGIAMNGHFN